MKYSDIVAMPDVKEPFESGKFMARTKLEAFVPYGWPSSISCSLEVLEQDGKPIALRFSQGHLHHGWSSHYRSYVVFDRSFPRQRDECRPAVVADTQDAADLELAGVVVVETANGAAFLNVEFLEGEGVISGRKLLVDPHLVLEVTVPGAKDRGPDDDRLITSAIHPAIVAEKRVLLHHVGTGFLIAGAVERNGRCYVVAVYRDWGYSQEFPRPELRELGPSSLLDNPDCFTSDESILKKLNKI